MSVADPFGSLPAAVWAAALGALDGEAPAHRTLVLARLERNWPDVLSGLRLAYGDAADAVAQQAALLAVAGAVARAEDLRLLDLRRLVEPDWFQSPRMLGYACYTDRFAGTLRGVAEHVPYLQELGVTYLHLMPLLQPRPAPNDGGYAVADYRQVRGDLGTVEDLAALAGDLRKAGISLTLDLVLNHVAAEHAWAAQARAGDRRYREYFHTFADREQPDAYERSLLEIFPDTAPGSFTWDDALGGWVWTTFNDWQWDLNWHNPDVFCEFVDLICFLANQGVECLRLDAIAFLWKRLGTQCQNQPEVHSLTQALRACARIAAPALVLKAEAIVGPDQLVKYLGVGRYEGRVSDLAYHNSLMVQVWSALASQDARLMTTALRRFPAKPTSTAWATYLRCHDDIGWAIDDADAAAVGWSGEAHRRFLSDWYSGVHPGSGARGLVFQENPVTGDRRISGMAASLAGVEHDVDGLAIGRLLLAHLTVLGFGGIPLLWMGDELALTNDESWDSVREHSDDNRWVHRPVMPWDVAARRHDTGTREHLVWTALLHAVRVRAGLPAMHAAVESELLDAANTAVVGWIRRGREQSLVALHNMSSESQVWPRHAVPLAGCLTDALTGASTGETTGVLLPPYGCVWLVEPAA